MPHQNRRAFLRSSTVLTLACWVSACRAPVAAVPGTQPPQPTATPLAGNRALLPLVQGPTAPAAPAQLQFSGEQALAHAAAQMEWVPRDTGSPGWQQCGDYIAAQLAAQGWQAENQFFDYKGVRCRNIIGKRGSGPRIIIGAHYDSRRKADQDPDPAKRDQPVPAANDGASGIAVLLELARVLQPAALGREIWLAAFDAEDNGDLDGWDWIVGSTYLANSLAEAPQAVVVIDMIGDAEQQIYYEQNSTVALREGIWRVAQELGYTSFIAQPRYAMLDDHTGFLNRGFPAVDLIDFDYPYWHTTADTLDKISAASLEAVGRTLEAWLQRDAPGASGVLSTRSTAYPAPAATPRN